MSLSLIHRFSGPKVYFLARPWENGDLKRQVENDAATQGIGRVVLSSFFHEVHDVGAGPVGRLVFQGIDLGEEYTGRQHLMGVVFGEAQRHSLLDGEIIGLQPGPNETCRLVFGARADGGGLPPQQVVDEAHTEFVNRLQARMDELPGLEGICVIDSLPVVGDAGLVARMAIEP